MAKDYGKRETKNKGSLKISIMNVGYRMGKNSVGGDIRAYDLVDEIGAESVAKEIFTEEYRRFFMIGFESGFVWKVTKNTEVAERDKTWKEEKGWK